LRFFIHGFKAFLYISFTFESVKSPSREMQMRTTHIGLTFLFLLFSLSPFPAVCQSAAKAPSPAMDQQTIDVLNNQAKDAMKKGAFSTALKLLTLTAKEGSPEGELWLANMYMSGSGVTKSYAHAVIYLKQAASKGYPRAMGALGVMYFNGFGVPVDKKLGRQWLQKSADAGDDYAKAELAQLDAANANKAIPETNTATTTIQTDSQSWLGELLHIWTDPATGLKWTRIVEDKNVSWEEANSYCRNLSLYGTTGWRLATFTEMKDIYDSTQNVGGHHIKGGINLNMPTEKFNGIWTTSPGISLGFVFTAIFSETPGLGRGNAEAVIGSGRALCVNGPYHFASDEYANSMTLQANAAQPPSLLSQLDDATIQQRAQSGEAAAEVELGNRLSRNINFPTMEAVPWYRKAAEQGEPVAQFWIGWMYFEGLLKVPNPTDVENIYTEATVWLTRSANQGNAAAEYQLSKIYANGLGGKEKNLLLALKLARQSAAQGYPLAKLNIDGYVYEMTQNGIAVPPEESTQSTSVVSTSDPAADKAQEISDKIDELNSDIESHQQLAEIDDNSAANATQNNNCSGIMYSICASANQMLAAKFRADANKERNAIADDQAQIARLQGQRNATAQHLDTSFGGNLQTNNSTGYNQTTNNFNTNTFSNANNGDAAVAACKSGNPYLNDNSLCQSNPNLQQASCYRAAADICRCYLNAYPGNSNSSQWQSCVVNNDAKADQLNSSSHSIGGGTTQTNSNGNSGNSGNINLNNCPPGAIGCAGVAK
jgi:TPR repeat protein